MRVPPPGAEPRSQRHCMVALAVARAPWSQSIRVSVFVTESEVVRDINRQIVLNLIRTRQPISRADLARVSGLQRSTISLIVEQLMEECWVLEGAMGRLPRGRRPTFLRLNDERVIIGVDIRSALASWESTSALGRRSPRSIWLRYGLLTPACSASCLSEIRAECRRSRMNMSTLS